MKYTFFISIALGLVLSGCSISQSIQPTDTNGQNPATGNNPSGTRLDLSNQNLEQIPAYVFSLDNLEELNISNNKLTGAIPAEIRNIQKLKILNASNNQMTGVPAEIGQLSNLEELNLSNNQLTGLPYELGNLKNLKTFNISGNNYSTLDLNIIKENLPENVNIIE